MLPSCRAFYHQFCSHHGAKSKIPTKSVNFLWRGKRNVVFNMNFEKIHSNTKFLLTKLPCSTLCSSHQKKGSIKNDTSFFGAEGETRTLAPVTRPTPLAGAPRHQLEYFCIGSVYDTIRLLKERAENPLPLLSGGESGIRTHGTLPYDGFQDRSVITTSVSLRIRRKL